MTTGAVEGARPFDALRFTSLSSVTVPPVELPVASATNTGALGLHAPAEQPFAHGIGADG
jgi:hypothetical protein